MCVTFKPARPESIVKMTGRILSQDYPAQVWPTYPAPIIRGDGDVLLASFGLLPNWAKDRTFAKHTYNARSETVDEKPSFKDAWRRRQWCLVPMEAFFEPCYESGKAVSTSIGRSDSEPFAVAGLWSEWLDKTTGEIVPSFTMLTINADHHPLMSRMHKPGDEKRSLVAVAPEHWGQWLSATPATAKDYLSPLPTAFVA